MAALLNHYNSLNILAIKLCIFIFLIRKSLEEILCSYPLTKRLNNGNYMLVCSLGIFFYDSKFQHKINGINTTNCDSDCVFSTSYTQFLEEDGGYIVVLHKGIIYIFSENGNYISNNTISYFTSSKEYTIVAYEHSEQYYYFVIIYTNSSNIYFKKYQINSLSTEIILKDTYCNQRSSVLNIGISCQLMLYLDNKVITCFYGDSNNIYISNFNIFNNYEYISNLGTKTIQFTGNAYYKSDFFANSRDKIVGCKGLNNHNCLGYDIKNNTITESKLINTKGFSDNALLFTIKYFPETNEILAGSFCGKIFNYIIYNNNLESISSYKNDILSKNCNNPLNIDFIYSSNLKTYLILTTESNQCGTIFSFNGNSSGYNYNSQYFYYIPEGYFLNDTKKKTIDKCHSDCKTCDKKEIQGNSNCKTCKDNKFLDLGNCNNSCSNGYFTDPKEEDIIRCKCSDIKCEFCSEESKSLDLCITCNYDSGYYPIYNFGINVNENFTIKSIINNSSYIDCFKDPNNYYLYKDNDTYAYKPCFNTCRK